MNLETMPTGWLVIGRKPGESLQIGNRTLTYEGRLADTRGDAILTLTEPSGGWRTLRLTAGEELHLPSAQCFIRWMPRRDDSRSTTIRLNVRAPRDQRIVRHEVHDREPRPAVAA